VITGGASGLGKRLAELFAAPESLGARVAIIDNNLEGAESVVEAIRRESNGLATVRAWRCDISDSEAMNSCADEIRREFGRVDIVVCNAAVLFFALCMDLKDREIKKALDVNILGTINVRFSITFRTRSKN
jgi:NAD(P)-dependent dehydrogenase (short-subunit alcohol dehydrogenase family)